MALTKHSADHLAVLFDLMQPPLHVGEALSIGDVIHHDDTMRASVVSAKPGC